jgi:hypothetical protein
MKCVCCEQEPTADNPPAPYLKDTAWAKFAYPFQHLCCACLDQLGKVKATDLRPDTEWNERPEYARYRGGGR